MAQYPREHTHINDPGQAKIVGCKLQRSSICSGQMNFSFLFRYFVRCSFLSRCSLHGFHNDRTSVSYLTVSRVPIPASLPKYPVPSTQLLSSSTCLQIPYQNVSPPCRRSASCEVAGSYQWRLRRAHQFITSVSRRKTVPRASKLLLVLVERWITSF